MNKKFINKIPDSIRRVVDPVHLHLIQQIRLQIQLIRMNQLNQRQGNYLTVFLIHLEQENKCFKRKYFQLR